MIVANGQGTAGVGGAGTPTPESTGADAPVPGSSGPVPTDKKSFWDKLDQAIWNLVDVTVATIITDVRVTTDDQGRLTDVVVPPGDVPAIVSNVNLIDGHVTTTIGPSLKDDATLMTFHQGLVSNAVKVLPDNIKGLAGLIESWFNKGKPATPAKAPGDA
jgi:hypothetical protein